MEMMISDNPKKMRQQKVSNLLCDESWLAKFEMIT